MTPSPSVHAAATTLAGWARQRRGGWSDIPIELPEIPAMARTMALVDVIEPVTWEPAITEAVDIDIDLVDDPGDPDDLTVALAEETEEIVARPSVFLDALAGLKDLMERLEPLGALVAEWPEWLMRGAAVVSMTSVVMFIGVNRGEVSARWDRMTAMALAAAKRAETPAARVDTPPAGTGRLTVASADGMAQVLIDGAPKGAAPLTVDLPAGAHRVLLKSPAGSVERVIRIRAGEPSDLTESIFPGWVALTTAVDLTMSEAGQPLKRDERGWAILPPGPHDLHLDNRALGVHEVRRVVVLPGDTTRLSFVPHASTMSLTTNEVAEVWIDGAPFGQAPLVDQPVAVGVHDVRVRSALHEKWLRIRATVQPVQINVDLTAQ